MACIFCISYVADSTKTMMMTRRMKRRIQHTGLQLVAGMALDMVLQVELVEMEKPQVVSALAVAAVVAAEKVVQEV